MTPRSNGSAGQLDALVVRNQPLRDWRALLPGAQLDVRLGEIR